MKYIKKYNEDIDWDFFDDEEINPKLMNHPVKIIKFQYNGDKYSHKLNGKNYRLLLCLKSINNNEPFYTFDKKGIILDDIYQNTIVFGEIQRFENITKEDYDIIKNNDFWITNLKHADHSTFRKWKFSELEQKFNIYVPDKIFSKSI